VTTGATRVPRYSAERVATRANAVTLARMVLCVPLLIWMAQTGAAWPLLVAWIALGATDGVDGWLARRDGSTRSGAFLDPLADKFYSAGGFVALAVYGTYAWPPVVLLVAREVGISVYRSFAARRGTSVPARMLGKIKTNVQIVVVGLALVPPLEHVGWLHTTALWFATAVTVLSGAQIVWYGVRRPRVVG
jgi:CDP-diacylglycerol--glycerol-3-phosphate 3-phosphatidyltransferase